jgi:peptidoglycan hydrolase-like protein with peptidoglycan-binding domain
MGRLVRQGCKGADVRAFHIRRMTPLAVDGDFGPRTNERAVEFQRSNALMADGIVGPRTMAKLFEEEQLPIALALVPQEGSTVGGPSLGIQPPRLIPPLTLPPLTPPRDDARNGTSSAALPSRQG